MALMPRGEPRSVPDPDREGYDAMIRQERLKRLIAENPFSPSSEYFSSESRPVDALPRPARGLDLSDRRTPPNAPFSTVPSTVSPAELVQRREAITRAFFMADSPLAGAAYGMASAAGASPQARDQAMIAGGAVDDILIAAAPFGKAAPIQPALGYRNVASENFTRPSVRPGGLNENNQAQAVRATINPPMLGRGTRANWRQTPPGWQGNGRDYNEARAHLYARSLGGAGKPWNIFTMTHQGANTPQMSGFERQVAQRVRGGETIEYSAMPLYEEGILPPTSVLLTAVGSEQRPVARLIRNPAGVRR